MESDKSLPFGQIPYQIFKDFLVTERFEADPHQENKKFFFYYIYKLDNKTGNTIPI